MSKKIVGILALPALLSLCFTSPAVPQNEETVILEGVYWVGPTGMGIRVEGDQYQYYDELGPTPWRPITELEYVKDGVIFDGENYWCLSTLPQPNGVSVCSSEGWVAA